MVGDGGGGRNNQYYGCTELSLAKNHKKYDNVSEVITQQQSKLLCSTFCCLDLEMSLFPTSV